MQRCISVLLKQIVQCRDITESKQPFRMLIESREINLINQMYGSVSSTAAKDGFHIRIVHCILQIFKTLFDCSGISPGRAAGMLSYGNFQSP